MAQMTEDEIRTLAQRKVAEKKSFYHSLFIYLIINAMLFVVWFLTGRGHPWFLWVLFFWGISLAFQSIKIFVFPKEGGDWERREIQKEMDKIRKTQS